MCLWRQSHTDGFIRYLARFYEGEKRIYEGEKRMSNREFFRLDKVEMVMP